MKVSKKGFTLIELLIVIAIIGILAVAFLPSLLGAPAKGRDTQRVADLQKIQKVLVNANLEGKSFPNADDAIEDITPTGYAAPDDNWDGAFSADFGGTLPADPQPDMAFPAAFVGATNGKYYYKSSPGEFSFGLFARVELADNANSTCSGAFNNNEPTTPVGDNDAEWCYVIFTK